MYIFTIYTYAYTWNVIHIRKIYPYAIHRIDTVYVISVYNLQRKWNEGGKKMLLVPVFTVGTKNNQQSLY